jgi:hypothetical protein
MAAVAQPPPSLASDCSEDVSDGLRRWLQRLPDGAHVELEARACYRVETEVKVRGKRNWTLDGRGALLLRTEYTPPARRYPRANASLRLIDFVDSEIRNLRIRSTNRQPDLPYLPPNAGSYRQEVEFDAGLALHGAVRVRVSHIRVRSVWGDGIYLAGGDQHTGAWSNHVVLSDVRITQNGRQGIAINRSRNVVVVRAKITYSRRAGIDLEPDTSAEVVSGIEVRDSMIGSNLLAISSAGSGKVNHVDVHDNVITRTGVPWVYVRSTRGLARRDWRIRDNVVLSGLGSPMPAMAFWNTHDIEISGNVMAIATTQSELAVGLFDGSDGARITCNTFKGAKREFVSPGSRGVSASRLNSLTPLPTGCSTTRRFRRAADGVPVPPIGRMTTSPLVGFAKRVFGLKDRSNAYTDRLSGEVAALQRQRGLPATGVVDERSWRVLLQLPRARDLIR